MSSLQDAAPGVLVRTSEMYVTTSTVVKAAGGGCLVIDPAVTVADLRALAAELAGRGLRPVAGWSTHPHWDHLLWCAELGDVRRYATARAVAAADRQRAELASATIAAAPGHDLAWLAGLTAVDQDAGWLHWDGPAAQVLSHDGHAPGHGALFLPDTGILIAGDMCSDAEIPLLDLTAADPIGDYRAGLELLGSLSRLVRLVIPGHGSVARPAEFARRLDADRRYLDALERGQPADDPRLDDPRPGQQWLRAEHASQLQFAAATRHGAGWSAH